MEAFNPVTSKLAPIATKLLNSIGMTNGHVQTNDPAIAPADDVNSGDVQMIQQPDHVCGHIIVVQRTRRIGRKAMIAAVGRDDEMV